MGPFVLVTVALLSLVILVSINDKRNSNLLISFCRRYDRATICLSITRWKSKGVHAGERWRHQATHTCPKIKIANISDSYWDVKLFIHNGVFTGINVQIGMIIGYLPMFPRPPVGAWYPFMAAELYPLPLLWGVDPLEPYPLGERLEPWPLVYPATCIDKHLPKLKNIRSEFLFIIVQVLFCTYQLQYNVIIIECLVCPPNTR